MTKSNRRATAARDIVAAAMTTVLLAMPALSGCAAARTQAPVPASASLRVIVRFAPGAGDPTDPAFLERLARTSHVTRVEPLHPMSGGAHVMNVICVDPAGSTTGNPAADPCTAALARLATNRAVASIEADAKVRTQ